MSAFDRMVSAFTCSLVHVLTVKYLNIRNIRKSRHICLKFFVVLFIIYFSASEITQKRFLFYSAALFLIPVCTYYIYRISAAKAFILSAASDFIILSGRLTSQKFISRSIYYTTVKNAFSLFMTAVIISSAGIVKKRSYSKKPSASWPGIRHVLYFLFINIAVNISLFSYGIDSQDIFLMNLIYKFSILLFLIYSQALRFKSRFEQRSRGYFQLNKYIRFIENMYDELSSQRHNFSNILFSITGYVDDNRIAELKDYLSNHVLKDYSRKPGNISMASLKHIHNPALKGIIFSKLNHAATKNIKLFVNIFNEIEICSIDPADLVKMIGILLDNAIEACENSPGTELHLGMDSDNNHISILIGNTFGQLPDFKQMGERGYSTKGKGRGFGLYDLKKILSMYPNAHLKTTVDGNIFFQELIITK